MVGVCAYAWCRMAGEPRGCTDDCTLVLALEPNNEKALLRRGQGYEQREKYKEAFADYAAAKKLGASVRFCPHAIFDRARQMGACHRGARAWHTTLTVFIDPCPPRGCNDMRWIQQAATKHLGQVTRILEQCGERAWIREQRGY